MGESPSRPSTWSSPLTASPITQLKRVRLKVVSTKGQVDPVSEGNLKQVGRRRPDRWNGL